MHFCEFVIERDWIQPALFFCECLHRLTLACLTVFAWKTDCNLDILNFILSVVFFIKTIGGKNDAKLQKTESECKKVQKWSLTCNYPYGMFLPRKRFFHILPSVLRFHRMFWPFDRLFLLLLLLTLMMLQHILCCTKVVLHLAEVLLLFATFPSFICFLRQKIHTNYSCFVQSVQRAFPKYLESGVCHFCQRKLRNV